MKQEPDEPGQAGPAKKNVHTNSGLWNVCVLACV